MAYVAGDPRRQLAYVDISFKQGGDDISVRHGYITPLPDIVVGAKVTKGQVIGIYDKSLAPEYGTGITEHVHIQAKRNGQFVNPQNYIAP